MCRRTRVIQQQHPQPQNRLTPTVVVRGHDARRRVETVTEQLRLGGGIAADVGGRTERLAAGRRVAAPRQTAVPATDV
jgi:hypothetical protein